MCQLTQTALKDENDCSDTTELDEDVEAGQRAAETVCQYVDWLLPTVNPNPPDEGISIRPQVSLNGSRKVRDTTEEGESCTDYSLLDVYANREQYKSSKM